MCSKNMYDSHWPDKNELKESWLKWTGQNGNQFINEIPKNYFSQYFLGVLCSLKFWVGGWLDWNGMKQTGPYISLRKQRDNAHKKFVWEMCSHNSQSGWYCWSSVCVALEARVTDQDVNQVDWFCLCCVAKVYSCTWVESKGSTIALLDVSSVQPHNWNVMWFAV